jgi:hypothetical protein
VETLLEQEDGGPYEIDESVAIVWLWNRLDLRLNGGSRYPEAGGRRGDALRLD